MANTTDVNDIRQEALSRVGEVGTDTSGGFYVIALAYVIEKFHEFRFHKPWKFTMADPPAPFASVAPISRTVSVTNGSTGATLASSVATSIAGFKIIIGNNVYRITAHTAGATAITLDLAYIDGTETAASSTIYQDEFNLDVSDFGRIVRLRDMRTGDTLRKVDVENPRIRNQMANPAEGVPAMYAELTDTRIIFNLYPPDARRYEYDYQVEAADPAVGETPDIPRRWRFGLRDGVAAKLASDKNDDRYQLLQSEFLATLERMEREESWHTGLDGIEEKVIV